MEKILHQENSKVQELLAKLFHQVACWVNSSGESERANAEKVQNAFFEIIEQQADIPQNELVRCHDDAILMEAEDGRKLAIRQSNITAVESTPEGTRIYFHGNSVTVANPLKEVLVMVGLCKDTA